VLSLLQRLNRLKLGGAFLFADVMEPSTERARRHFATAWKVELFTHTREQQVAMFFSGWLAIGDAPGQVPPNWKQSMIVARERYARERATPYVNLHHLYITHGATACNGEQTREE
jgi:hypothetical protein